MREQLQLGDLITSIRDHIDYIGLDALVEKVDDTRIMITLEG
ncbi:MAG: hypothetical protein BWY45_03307 [Euryarchaeota archaeon ADurb.Bin294]|nr:MAG: hypothetical protein BWY45_03307 [Euryarchaeota archaeon ADurb.Bin294]